MRQEIEQAVSALLLEQDFNRIDFAGGPPEYDATDEHYANEFMSDWRKGGMFFRGTWHSFDALDNALYNWTSETEIELSRGFLMAVRELFANDPASQASVDYLLSGL